VPRAKPPKAPYPLVVVEWEDSAQPISAWQWVDDYREPEILKCLSVGYLITETDTAIALAPNLGDVTREKAQACGIIRIPQRAITRTWRL
jgi:hypothetical protein